ncbi:MAG: hypothetical protein NTX52_10485, partial [Planctomycetota bacterium]|nr:hypothetical protein [Planctomycetota bacterium]
GVILYHMLTGQYPYDITGSTLEVLQNIQKADPIRPRQLIRKFDPDVEAILLAALAKDPAQRYQSAADLHSDIENWLQGRPIRVRSISTMYLLRKIITRHRYTSTVAALLLLIVLSFSYVSFDLYVSAKKAKKESDAIGQQWAAQAAKQTSTSRQMTFNFVLFAWYTGRDKKAKEIAANFLKRGSKEYVAAEFLLNPAPIDKKEPLFRQALSDQYPWFVDFILGEYHLKTGNYKAALEDFQHSYQAIQQLPQNDRSNVDRWLVTQLRSRLDELNALNKPSEGNTIPEKAGKPATESVQ